MREAFHYKSRGANCYEAHPSGPCELGTEIHENIRKAMGPDMKFTGDPAAGYTLEEAIRVRRHLEKLGYE